MAHTAYWIMVVTVITVISCAAGTVWAHGPNDPPHQRYQMGDLKLESGQLIKDVVLSYVTHGTLNAKKSNTILMVTALGGNHHRIDFLMGVTLILTIDSLPAFAQGNDFPRQRH